MTEAISRRARFVAEPFAGETGVVTYNPVDSGTNLEFVFTFDRDVEDAWPQVAGEPHPGKRGWWVSDEEFEYYTEPTPPPAPTIATALRLGPQDKTVLAHLMAGKPLSPMKALVVYGIFRLAACVHRIRTAGYAVKMTLEKDEGGHKYAVYTLAS